MADDHVKGKVPEASRLTVDTVESVFSVLQMLTVVKPVDCLKIRVSPNAATVVRVVAAKYGRVKVVGEDEATKI